MLIKQLKIMKNCIRKHVIYSGLIFVMTVLVLCACRQKPDSAQDAGTTTSVEQEKGTGTIESYNSESVTAELHMRIGSTEVAVDWEDNESVAALKELVADHSLEINTSAYGGFEQVGSLGTSLPRNDEQITTETGDIMLYSGDQIVVFYGPNSWAYTRLGKITDKMDQELAELLGVDETTIFLEMR